MTDSHPVADLTLQVRHALVTVSHLERSSKWKVWEDLPLQTEAHQAVRGLGTTADGAICTLALRQNVSSGEFSIGMCGW